ncbi:MAG: DNA cytosine methyltransferase [Streptosporangiaceae bacterium]
MSTCGIGSLCTGCGGLDLAVMEVTGGELAWCADNDPPLSAILAARFPVPNLGTVTHADWVTVLPVDVTTGGLTCRDISFAGRGAGLTKGTRSSAWNRVMDAVQIAVVPGSPPDLTWPHETSADAAGPGRKASQACTPAPQDIRGRPAPPAAAQAPQSQAGGQLAATLAQRSSSREAARAPSRDAPRSRPAPAGSRRKRDCR